MFAKVEKQKSMNELEGNRRNLYSFKFYFFGALRSQLMTHIHEIARIDRMMQCKT